MKRGVAYLVTVGVGALTLASMAKAQSIGSVTQEGTEDPAPEAITTSNEIVVLGEINYRNRTDDAEPVLSYGSEYFQRFEPLTAGDALKRVPGVPFLSDVIESDGARLRGLDPGYTQILINGEKVPGSNVDRSFFLDRIRNRFNLTAAARIYDQFDDNPTRFATDFDPADADIAASNIEEQRHDVFALVEGKSGAIDWEAGVRYETTRTRIDTLKTDYQHLLPSASAKIALSPRDRVLLSIRPQRRTSNLSPGPT